MNEIEHQEEVYSKTIFGFWVYLLTDFVLFGVLFAVYVILHANTYGGPSSRELFSIPYALVQTLVLLLSAFTIGIGGALAHRRNKGASIVFFLITFVLGLLFMGMELYDFFRLIQMNSSWTRSGFLSGYFTLVGTHGIHMCFALLWVIVILFTLKNELTFMQLQRLTCLRMFWQFLNIVWVFIFTIVYLLGGRYA